MKNHFLLLFGLCTLSLFFGCNDSEPQTDEGKPKVNQNELRDLFSEYAKVLRAGDLKKLGSITTNQGYGSILEWTDSLRNAEWLVVDLENFNVFNLHENDEWITVSLGKSDKIVGATGGYLFLKDSAGCRINEFRGGE